ncbi:MAG TPA: nucleoside-triphosphatase [Anaerolineae bacterium]|jgi:nucleoside-triphosphatase THEP1|nr:nucleoside-triphosphatase [Anaerolineae bacterium]
MTKTEMPSRIVILTGERGVGKSTVCHKTVGLAQARQYTCGGVLTLSHSNGGRDVLDVRSGDVRRLTLEPDAGEGVFHEGVIQGRFRFDPAVLAWGNDVLSRAAPCHLLVVDELGPLEMERGRGWVKAFDVLEDTDFTLALVVVRPELLVRVQLRLPTSATTVFTVTGCNRDGLPEVLLKVLESTAG